MHPRAKAFVELLVLVIAETEFVGESNSWYDDAVKVAREMTRTPMRAALVAGLRRFADDVEAK